MEAKVLAVDQIGAITTRSIPPLLVMHASGRVPTGGWDSPRLVPAVYIQAPADGIWDFDFVAEVPAGPAIEVIMPVAANITLPLPKWCKGVRVRAASNEIEYALFPRAERAADTLGDSFIPIPLTVTGSSGGSDAFPWHVNPQTIAAALERLGALAGSDRGLEAPLSSLVGKRVRVFHEGDLITMDHVPERFNLELEAVGTRVKRVFFG